ncbi:GerAB/ArcD/ProY family transporter [Sporosarcina sp.]|uniref:GerAB/ArcD/ProY family transporter n=1 Tax=Sporosarcina sp. TaxID=49982 RepID=UPI00260A34D9|nr:GerAB/ArcD/ProY family transporter [Sporosarcina sp.]
MSRFVYYLLLSNMVANILAAVPRILLSKSSEGAVLSIILALIYGVIGIWVFIRLISKFPGKNLPELFKTYLSKWVGVPLLLLFGIVWYIAGLQSLITYVAILSRFLTPEMSIYMILGAFVAVITFGLFMQSRNVLFLLEVIFVLLLPIIVLFLGKIYFTEQIDWDQVKIAAMHINHAPSYTAFAAASYVFVGIFDLIIFNSVIKKKIVFKWKQAIIIFMFGSITLATTYFIPIGVLGFDSIKDFVYPWVSTSDSVRMQYGIVERVIFLFLLNFLAIAFLNIMLHWFVAFKLFQSTFSVDQLAPGTRKYFSNTLIIIVFWTVGVLVTIQETEYNLFQYSNYYFNALPAVSAVLFIALLIVNRRAKFEKS